MEVSILLPYYAESTTDFIYLKKALLSIFRQKQINHFECILINNAESLSINQKDQLYLISEKYLPAFYIVEEPQKGITNALTQGYKKSSAPYIARMDADDIMHPLRLYRQKQYLDKNPEIDLIASTVKHRNLFSREFENSSRNKQQYREDNGFRLYVEWSNSIQSCEDIEKNRFIESPIVHPSVMFRRSTAEKYGSWRHGNFPEDYELWLRWLEAGVKIAKLSEVLITWNDSKDRLSRNHHAYSSDAFFETKAYYIARYIKGLFNDENSGSTFKSKIDKPKSEKPSIGICGHGRLVRKRASMLEKHGINIEFYTDMKPKSSSFNVITYEELPPPGKIFLVSYVASRGARDIIRNRLQNMGYIEMKDFILAA